MKHTAFNYILAVVILVVASSCGKKAKQDQEAKADADPTQVQLTAAQFQTSGIEVGAIQEKQLSGTLKVNGKLEVPPQNLISITVPFGGYLKSTELLQGLHVRKGQLIAELQGPEYIQLQESYLDSKSQLDFLNSEYLRQERLAKENVNAQKTFQQAKADYQSMLAKTNGLESRLALLNIKAADLQEGKFHNSVQLYSPVTGYVTEVNVNIGAFVTPSDVLFRIADTEHMHADLLVFEKDVPKLQVGQVFSFTLGNESKERKATIHLIGHEIAKDRTVQVHGHLSTEDQNLIPGTYLKAIIETGGEKVPALPESAVVQYEGKDYIFIQEDSVPQTHSFKLLSVKTGLAESGFIQVTLPDSVQKQGMKVVMKGAYDLLSKMKNSEQEE